MDEQDIHEMWSWTTTHVAMIGTMHVTGPRFDPEEWSSPDCPTVIFVLFNAGQYRYFGHYDAKADYFLLLGRSFASMASPVGYALPSKTVARPGSVLYELAKKTIDSCDLTTVPGDAILDQINSVTGGSFTALHLFLERDDAVRGHLH